MQYDYYCWDDKSLIFNVFLQPNSSRNVLVGLHDDAVKIAITSPPVDGEANKQLIKYLAKLFCVKKSNISMIAGEHSRRKRIKVLAPLTWPGELFVSEGLKNEIPNTVTKA